MTFPTFFWLSREIRPFKAPQVRKTQWFKHYNSRETTVATKTHQKPLIVTV